MLATRGRRRYLAPACQEASVTDLRDWAFAFSRRLGRRWKAGAGRLEDAREAIGGGALVVGRTAYPLLDLAIHGDARRQPASQRCPPSPRLAPAPGVDGTRPGGGGRYFNSRPGWTDCEPSDGISAAGNRSWRAEARRVGLGCAK